MKKMLLAFALIAFGNVTCPQNKTVENVASKSSLVSKLNPVKFVASASNALTGQFKNHPKRTALVVALVAALGWKAGNYLYEQYVQEENEDDFLFS